MMRIVYHPHIHRIHTLIGGRNAVRLASHVHHHIRWIAATHCCKGRRCGKQQINADKHREEPTEDLLGDHPATNSVPN